MESVWPDNERARLEALQSYDLLDSLPEASFDRLTRLASAICGVPIALVSLIDSDRQWFKSRVGLDVAETARNVSFCQYAILGAGIMEVEDASRDDRFRSNPLVTGNPEIRFYAGAPLIDPNGFALGTLCVIDRQPRRLTDEQRKALRDLADEVMEQIRIRTERHQYRQVGMRLSSIIEGTNVGTWEWNVQTGQTIFNERWAQIIGYTLAELQPVSIKTWQEFAHPDDLHESTRQLELHFSGKAAFYECESRMQHRDGHWVWVLDRGKVFSRTDDGKPLWMYGTHQDITERKAAEKALADSRARYASIVAALPDLVFLFDAEGRYLDCHAGDYTRLWMPPENFIGHNVSEVLPPQFSNLVMGKMRETLEKRALVSFRYDNENPQTGETEYFEARMVPTEHDHVLCVIRDLSAETRQTQNLAHAQQLLTLTGRVARLGAWEYWPKQKRLHLSDVLRELLEISPLEPVTLADALVRFVPKPYFATVESAVSLCIEQGKPFDLELSVVTARGRTFWVRAKGAASFSDGVCTSIHGTVQDIESIKQAQIALEAARLQAEAANRAKSDFLSNMSHELRTPLNSILGFSQLLEMNTESHLNQEELENVGHIRRAGSHLLNLISEILDLSRIESGQMDLLLEDTSIVPLLQEAVVFVRPMAQRRHVKISISGHNEITVHADRIRLKQVMLNLLTNAIKYNRFGGSVSIEYAALPGGFLRIAVTDTGTGIAENQITQLFRPFQRLGAENSTIEGTGIGLTITRRLAELMQGQVFLESTSPAGSTFCIDIPLAGQKSRANTTGAAAPERAPAVVCGTVLCVEDNPDSMSLMEHFFRRMENITLLTARSGHEALQIAEREKPDLILLDIHLPGLSGFETLSRLREMTHTVTVPIVAISAAATKEDIRRGQTAGFDEYLTKPVRLDLLSEVVARYCHARP